MYSFYTYSKQELSLNNWKFHVHKSASDASLSLSDVGFGLSDVGFTLSDASHSLSDAGLCLDSLTCISGFYLELKCIYFISFSVGMIVCSVLRLLIVINR